MTANFFRTPVWSETLHWGCIEVLGDGRGTRSDQSQADRNHPNWEENVVRATLEILDLYSVCVRTLPTASCLVQTPSPLLTLSSPHPLLSSPSPLLTLSSYLFALSIIGPSPLACASTCLKRLPSANWLFICSSIMGLPLALRSPVLTP